MESNRLESAKLASAREYRQERQKHWDLIACKQDSWKSIGAFYHKRLGQNYSHLVSPDHRGL